MRPMLQLVADVPLLASHIALWSSSFDGLNLPFMRDLLAGAADQVKIVGHQATSLLQVITLPGIMFLFITESRSQVYEDQEKTGLGKKSFFAFITLFSV